VGSSNAAVRKPAIASSRSAAAGVREMEVDAAAHEHPEGAGEQPLDRPGGVGQVQVRQVQAVGEAPEQGREPPPHPHHGDRIEVVEQPLGDDGGAARGIEAGGQGGQRGRAVVGGGVDLDHPVVGAGAADPGQGRALLGGHAREVGLDVGDAIAVVAGEAPAARRQPTGDLDHLTDLAAIDRGAELGVDQVVPREEQAVEVGLAGGAQELVGGREAR
jgi:hypothetical protein